jgi:hypothetical protein
MNVKNVIGAVLAALSLSHISMEAQNTIGVGVPTGTSRNDTYIAAGFEFFAPAGGTTINALGFWDANGTGLLTAHTVSIFKYDSAFDPSGYALVATATIPSGTTAPLINGYRWVGIPTLTLPNNGQGGGYYAILATQNQDAWATGIGSAPYLNPSIGTISGEGLLSPGGPYTVLSSQVIINGTANPNDGFGGANLAFLATPAPTQPVATPILWVDHNVFTDDTFLSLAGAVANEVYGVDFGGSGLQTTTNGYSFNDYATSGNMTLGGNLSSYNSYLSGGGTTGDNSLDAILNNGIYGESDIYGTLENLTVGQRYNVLAFAADTRGSSGIQFGVTDELSFSPLQTFSFPGGTPNLGGYVMGSFTATSTNQLFIISGQVQYNGILVEKVPATAITLVTNTLPASAAVAVGSNVVFTAAFSNSPSVSLQWQQIVSGSPIVTNNINSGVVTVTNAGVVSSTLTLTNVQVGSAGSYRLKATDNGNSANIAYSAAASLTILPLITWYAPGTYNGSFSNNSVLTLAGSVANEVYGVDFGGSGPQTTGNGYTFDDYATTGNFSVAGNPQGLYGGYMTGGATTGDGALDTLLTYGLYGSRANTGTLNNLTVGQTYTVMVLLDDTRGSAAGGQNFVVTDGVTVSPKQQYAFANGTPAVGGFIMGTFTAQTTNQPLTVENINGSIYNSQYNAILLMKGIAPPPPVAPTLATDIQPLLSEVAVGTTVTLSVVASGSVPLHYQWFDENGPVSGATNSSYPVNAVNGTNYYHVGISNAFGSIVSSTAVVISSPAIVTVKNFSFEFDVAAGPGAAVTTVPTDWTGFNKAEVTDIGSEWAGGNDYSIFDPLAPPADENQFCYINMSNPSVTGGIYQDVGVLQANTAYTLTVAIGSRADINNSPGIISLLNGTDNTGTLLATGGGLPASQDSWQDFSISFTNGVSTQGDLTVVLSVLGNATTMQADFDNVRLIKSSVGLSGPTLAAPKIAGGNLILTGAGGMPGTGYTLLTTTNLSPPIIWATNTTGTLDELGAFSNSIPVNGTNRASFFQLRLP